MWCCWFPEVALEPILGPCLTTAWSLNHKMMPAGGTPQQGEALLNFSQSFSNFGAFRAAPQFSGWTVDTIDTPCGWSGITCDKDTGLLNIYLTNQGLQGELGALVRGAVAKFCSCLELTVL